MSPDGKNLAEPPASPFPGIEQGPIEGVEGGFSIVDAIKNAHLFCGIFEDDFYSFSIVYLDSTNQGVRNLYLDDKGVAMGKVNIFHVSIRTSRC